jgi:hypothetical protein
MKKIYLFGLLALGMLALSSCNDGKDELTDSRLTYYADLQMQGDEFMLVPVGSKFVDPGCTGTLAGEDITSKIVIEGADEVDTNTLGFYYITYSAVGSDGYPASVERTVCVYDPTVTLDISGEYIVDMEASIYQGARTYADRAAYYGNTTQCTGITFDMIVPGIYYVNDIFGGWYDQIRGYGSRYDMTAYVSVDNDGNIGLLSSYIAGWGDGIDYLDEGTYEDGTISYSLCYAGQIYMDIVLDRVSD